MQNFPASCDTETHSILRNADTETHSQNFPAFCDTETQKQSRSCDLFYANVQNNFAKRHVNVTKFVLLGFVQLVKGSTSDRARAKISHIKMDRRN